MDVPAPVRGLASELAGRPGVIGVFWGSPRRGDQWRDELAICVHVERKEDVASSARIPREIDGFSTDVIEVGRPRAHSLGHTNVVHAHGMRSTPTAVTTQGADLIALGAGHALLPVGTQATTNGVNRTGRVEDGAFGGGASVDFALVRFVGEAAQAQTFHEAAQGSAPFLARAHALVPGDPLSIHSSIRGAKFPGAFRGISAHDTLIVTEDGEQRYSGLLVADRMSIAGDSGSLVVDSNGDVVGAIVGGNVEKNVSYIYDLRYLATFLELDVYDRFLR